MDVNLISTVDGKWSSWSKYGGCSVTCGGGSQYRSRKCNKPAPENGGKPCVGASQQSRRCNSQRCQSNMTLFCIIIIIFFCYFKILLSKTKKQDMWLQIVLHLCYVSWNYALGCKTTDFNSVLVILKSVFCGLAYLMFRVH